MTTRNRAVRRGRGALATAGAAALVLAGLGAGLSGGGAALAQPVTTTPIQHLVVIVDTGASFDHYFGTYPYAANTDGTTFSAAPGTPSVNGLYNTITLSGPTGPLLTANRNEYNPQRLTHSEALTSDQNHGYTPEQEAADNGQMDKFVQDTGSIGCGPPLYCPPGIVMDYYDGNTVTALWNYAQHDAMSDDNYQTTFGSASPAAVNLVSGDTSGAEALDPLWSSTPGAPTTDSSAVGDVNSGTGLGTLYGDADPYDDDCSDSNHTSSSPVVAMTGPNIGTLLNTAGVTWGWFQGGFAPTGSNAGGAVCGSSHQNIAGEAVQDYVPHMDPFQYYASTANPQHLPPTSEAAIGTSDQANHQYDLSDLATTLQDGNLPAVSFVEAPAYQDGHPGYSDPLDEQTFLATTINQIEQSSAWPTTAILVTSLNSEGWYDHAAPPIVNGSDDANTDTVLCTAVPGGLGGANDRCGYGMRTPLLAISPYAPVNDVSHVQIDQTSILRFIEDNWLAAAHVSTSSYDNLAGSLDGPGGVLDFSSPPHLDRLVLDPTTGAVDSDTASPSITTTPSPTSITLGPTPPTLNDTAVLFGGIDPTGTITFTLFNPAGTLADTETVAVIANGSYTTPVGHTLPSSGPDTGTYQWDASYTSTNPDDNDAAEDNATSEQVKVVSPCGALTAYFLSATYAAGKFSGLFCVNASGSGTYAQNGGATVTGTVKISGATTAIAASGTNLVLLGQKSASFNSFTETAPTPMKTGTFTLATLP